MKGIKLKKLAIQLVILAVMGMSIPIVMDKIGEYSLLIWAITVALYSIAIYALFHIERILDIAASIANPKNKKGIPH